VQVAVAGAAPVEERARAWAPAVRVDGHGRQPAAEDLPRARSSPGYCQSPALA
jgi:hypothetical protein